MKAFGEYLRRERELRGISLDEVAQSTKISANILDSLENGRLDSLPAIPFVKGFLRAYADYVGLDPASVVLRFEAAFLADEAEARRALGMPWARVRRMAFLGLAVVASAFALIELAIHRDALAELVKRKPAKTQDAPEPPPPTGPDEHTPTPEERIDRLKQELGLKEIEKTLKGPPVEVPSEPPSAQTQVPTSTAPGFRVPRRGPGDAGGADPGATREADEPAPPGQPTPKKPGQPATAAPRVESGSVLVLHGIASTWVQVIPDDGPPQDRLLQLGDDWSITARRFVLRVGDGGAVNLTLDGRDLGAAGDKGVFVRRELPAPTSRPAGRR
ncbi:MAG: helix-turn-helix domain-containing protein [Deltaproteobacteria bacterium]|nr:helix-turn-helix domain-containing protein [Deltaproteobacteria bacterium]